MHAANLFAAIMLYAQPFFVGLFLLQEGPEQLCRIIRFIGMEGHVELYNAPYGPNEHASL